MKCTGCGNPVDESMADEDDAPTYVAKKLKCWACLVSGAAASNEAEANKGRMPPGTYFKAERSNGHAH